MRILIMLFLCSICLFNNAQVNGGQLDKLRDLYNLEKYEDCLFKALKISESSKYEKDPEPYLYSSMCYLKLHKLNKDDMESEHKDALRNALKYALKFKFKDRSKMMYKQNAEYIKQLEDLAVQETSYHASNTDFRKASMLIGSLYRFDNNNAFQYYKGVLDILNKNSSGKRSIKNSLAYYQLNADSIRENPSHINGVNTSIENATIYYCDYLKKNQMEDSMKTVLKIIHHILPQSDQITRYHNKAMGINKQPYTQGGIKIIKSKDVSQIKGTKEDENTLEKDDQ